MTIAARPTTYRGIEMRSRLEATFAGFLDREGLTWEFEPRAFADEDGQYLPDFEIQVDGEIPTYVEVKGNVGWDRMRGVCRRMGTVLRSVPGASLAVVEQALWTRKEYAIGLGWLFIYRPATRAEWGLAEFVRCDAGHVFIRPCVPAWPCAICGSFSWEAHLNPFWRPEQ